MNDALSGFLTGFFERSASISADRREKADDFYAKQLERAQTIGLTKIQERKSRVERANGLANALVTQANVPPSVIRRAAEGGLDNLDQIQQIWTDANAKGIKTDKAFWEGVYGAAEADAEATGGDFTSSFSRIAGLQTPPPKEEKGDTKMTWADAIYGGGDMGRTWDRLENTQVADGYSAADLLRMETAQEQTGSVLLPNAEYLHDREVEAESRKPGSRTDVTALNTDFETYRKDYIETNKFNLPAEASEEERRAHREKIEAEADAVAAGKVAQVYGKDFTLQTLPYLAPYLQPEETAPEQPAPTPAPADAPITEAPAPEGLGGPAKSAASTEIPPGVRTKLRYKGSRYKAVGVAPDGNIIYQNVETGRKDTFPREYVMEADKQASSPATQATQQRLDGAMKRIVEGMDGKSLSGQELSKISEEQLFIGQDEQPPEVLNHPRFGALRLKEETQDSYIYAGQGPGAEVEIAKK